MIRGILIPVITPFDEKELVDEAMLRKLVDFYLKVPLQGLFVLGSSGQGPVMSLAERKRAAEIAINETRKRLPVVIHVGTADTESTVELARHAAEGEEKGSGVFLMANSRFRAIADRDA